MGSGWTVVAQFTQEAEARLLAGRLEAEGIETQVYPEFQGNYYGESLQLPYGVLVPEHRFLEARMIVEGLEAG